MIAIMRHQSTSERNEGHICICFYCSSCMQDCTSPYSLYPLSINEFVFVDEIQPLMSLLQAFQRDKQQNGDLSSTVLSVAGTI